MPVFETSYLTMSMIWLVTVSYFAVTTGFACESSSFRLRYGQCCGPPVPRCNADLESRDSGCVPGCGLGCNNHRACCLAPATQSQADHLSCASEKHDAQLIVDAE
jgi:hypothetical protein